MRTIEKEMLQAIKDKRNWSKSNTVVIYNPISDKSKVHLFGNLIGRYIHSKDIFETNIDMLLKWPSVTTISRLRALGVNVTQKNWKLYIDGQLIGNKLRYDYSDGFYKESVA